jgi:hypothetical protein
VYRDGAVEALNTHLAASATRIFPELDSGSFLSKALAEQEAAVEAASTPVAIGAGS